MYVKIFPALRANRNHFDFYTLLKTNIRFKNMGRREPITKRNSKNSGQCLLRFNIYECKQTPKKQPTVQIEIYRKMHSFGHFFKGITCKTYENFSGLRPDPPVPQRHHPSLFLAFFRDPPRVPDDVIYEWSHMQHTNLHTHISLQGF